MSQEVKLIAAFLGLRFLPLPLAIGSNSINPKLVLHDSTVEYRALFSTDVIRYSDIEEVDIYLAYKTTNISIQPKDSIFRFVGNLNNKARLIEVLRFLKQKNCSLTERALKLLLSS